jgi:2-haloacid dehalogenase
MQNFSNIKALTFDVFGTILDLGTSLKPFIAKFLEQRGAAVSVDRFWEQWRDRQRIEQYQDTLLMLGHSGYLETARRAFVYTLGRNRIEASRDQVADFMLAWQELSPFADVSPALERLKDRYKLVILSNGETYYLHYLAMNRIGWDFDAIISSNAAAVFKPHPAIYRRAAQTLKLEVGECLMVSANSFDAMGARACGYRAAYVNRYDLPYEDTPHLPDLTVKDFTELANVLL